MSANDPPSACKKPYLVLRTSSKQVMDITSVTEGYRSFSSESKDPKNTAEQEFLGWLRRNGALFHDVHWPSSETESGMRGAIATRLIDSGDHMVQIPHALMMSDFHAKADPDFGHVHRLNSRLLDSDNGLAIYIMQEILKEDKSFYWPYLRVLPTPHNLRSWSQEDLLLLQDHKLVRRVAARRRQLRALYHETMEYLTKTHPDLYSADRYTFELFDFAWSTVQARAFGKRLKSSALVPFADCLNHGNVQTKYDFDVEGNDTFRLFPSGTNRYPRRAEVLNSYGRRANDNLLLDYGFAMIDNEWDTAEVVCSLFPCDHSLDRRKAFLRSTGQNTVRILRVRRDVWSQELMRFCRCACLTAPELDALEAAAKQQATRSQESCPVESLKGTSAGLGSVSGSGDSKSTPQWPKTGRVHRSSAEAVRRTHGGSEDRKAQCLVAENSAPGNDPPVHRSLTVKPKEHIVLPDGRQRRRGGGRDGTEERANSKANGRQRANETAEGGGKKVVAAREAGRFPCKALSAKNELAALNKAMDCFRQARDAFPTTLEHDEARTVEEKAYREARAAQPPPPELVNALIYRVTIKRVLAWHLEKTEDAIARVQAFVGERSESCIKKVGNDEQFSVVHAPPSSSRLQHLLSSPSLEKSMTLCGGGSGGGGQHQRHRQTSGSTSFASYLSDVESVLLFRGHQEQQRSPRP